MISLNQMQLLDQKIESAITKIAALTDENKNLNDSKNALKNENESLQRKLVEETKILRESQAALKSENESLQRKLGEFQMNQSKIEQGILNALHRLEMVENTIIETAAPLQGSAKSDGTQKIESPDSSAEQSAARPKPVNKTMPADSAQTPGSRTAGETPAQSRDESAPDSAPQTQFDIF